MRLIVDSAALLAAIMDKRQTMTSAAEHSGISFSTMTRLTSRDCSVRPMTAGRLRRAFGDRVVRLIPAAAQV